MKLKELLKENSHFTPESFLETFCDPDEVTERGGKFYSDYSIQIQCRPENDFNKLPITFGKTGAFSISFSNKLNTLEGFPEECKMLQIFDCPNLTSLQHCTPLIDGNFDIRGTGIKSLVGISDIIKKINGEFYFDSHGMEEGGIGLILIDGLKDLQPTGISNSHYSAPHWSIIRKYLGKPDQLYDCQAELIEKGYEEYARL